MLPAIASQPFGAHLREPAAQLVAGQADRAADDDEVAGEAPADHRAGRVRARAPAVARAEQVERGQRGDDLGGRGEQERLLGMEGDAAAPCRRRRPARTSKAKLFAAGPSRAGSRRPPAAARRRGRRRRGAMPARRARALAAPCEPRRRAPTSSTSTKARQSAAATMRRSEGARADVATVSVGARSACARKSCRGSRQSRARRRAPPHSRGSGRRRAPPCAAAPASPLAAVGLARRAGGDAARAQVVVDARRALQRRGVGAPLASAGRGDQVELGARRCGAATRRPCRARRRAPA